MKTETISIRVIETPDSDLKVVNSARVSFDKEVFEMSKADEGLISYLARESHWSPFAHCRETFLIPHVTWTMILAFATPTDLAGCVWKLTRENIFSSGAYTHYIVRHSLYGWANLIRNFDRVMKEVHNPYRHFEAFKMVYHKMCERYPVSMDKLISGQDVKNKLNEEAQVEDIIEYIDPSLYVDGNPDFIDVTLCETVPIFVARQSFKSIINFARNEVSKRYVKDEPSIFIFEDGLRLSAENVKQGSSKEILPFDNPLYQEMQDHYQSTVDLYNKLITNNVCAEQARAVLPQSMITKHYTTASLTGWKRLVSQRLDSHAQIEIQILAKLINDKLKLV